MQKVFYVSRNPGNSGVGSAAPDLDRFQRIEQLNRLLSLGWIIKSFSREDNAEFFVLEKN